MYFTLANFFLLLCDEFAITHICIGLKVSGLQSKYKMAVNNTCNTKIDNGIDGNIH